MPFVELRVGYNYPENIDLFKAVGVEKKTFSKSIRLFETLDKESAFKLTIEKPQTLLKLPEELSKGLKSKGGGLGFTKSILDVEQFPVEAFARTSILGVEVKTPAGLNLASLPSSSVASKGKVGTASLTNLSEDLAFKIDKDLLKTPVIDVFESISYKTIPAERRVKEELKLASFTKVKHFVYLRKYQSLYQRY